MGLILIEGFEDISAWTTSSSVTATGARHGNCLSLPNGNSSAYFRIPAAQESDTITIGFALKVAGNLGSFPASIMNLLSDATTTTHLQLTQDLTGALVVTRPGTALVTTASGLIISGVWNYIELQAKLHDTTGSITLRCNGVQVGAVTNVDTKNTGTKTGFDTVMFSSQSGGTPTISVDDCYIMTGAGDSFQGDCTVETLYPNGNGNANQWIGSDGDSVNNYLLVNESGTPNTSTYTGSPATGQQDMYTMGDLVATAGTILGVCHQAYAAKTDSGIKQFKIVNRRSSDTKSAALDLTQTFAPYHYCLAQDPETSAPWTIANVNALQSGVEVV